MAPTKAQIRSIATKMRALADELDPPKATKPTLGDLPGWKLTFSDTFDTPCPEGHFLKTYGAKWGAYPSHYLDTNGQNNGTGSHYNPYNLSVIDGQLRIHVRIGADGKAQGAAPYPLAPGSTKIYDRLYGRREIRMKCDIVLGFKVAFLDWPASDRWSDGEIDFPEGGLNDTVYAFHHYVGDPHRQDAFSTGVPLAEWHTYTVEWTPNLIVFLLDGKEVGRSTKHVPNKPLHWILQTESNIGGTQPTRQDDGYVYVDYVAMWSPAS